MACPYCQETLTKKELEMWGPFPCPHCRKMVRVRRNYLLRLLRLLIIMATLFFVMIKLSNLVRAHIGMFLTITAGTVAGIHEYIMRLFPATIEPAPGGLGVS